MAEELINKHDELAKKFLTDVEAAKEFLQIHIPVDIKAKCDLDTLSIESGSYIDNDLRKRFSDVVYRLDLLDKSSCVYFYILLEHQSTPEKLMPVRILKYVLEILNKHIDEHGENEKLPLIVPLVLYNGERSPYPYPTDIQELMADQELAHKFPLGKFRLVDLTVIPDEEILQHGKIALLEMLAKHIRVREFRQVMQLILDALIVAHADHISKSLFDSALTYLMDARGESRELAPLFDKIVVNISEYKEEVMSWAEELRLEGEQRSMQKVASWAEELRLEGEQRSMQKVASWAEELRLEWRQESQQKTRQEIAKNLLMAGVDINLIATTTQLNAKEIKDLKKVCASNDS